MDKDEAAAIIGRMMRDPHRCVCILKCIRQSSSNRLVNIAERKIKTRCILTVSAGPNSVQRVLRRTRGLWRHIGASITIDCQRCRKRSCDEL